MNAAHHGAGDRPMVVLVVEDDPGDQLLIEDAFEQIGGPERELAMVDDGAQALDFLHRRAEHADAPRPDLVVLDLNLPKYDGRAVLREIKGDAALRTIPVVIFSTSAAAEDIAGTYELHANAYVTKPTDFDHFTSVVGHINDFFTRLSRTPGA
ncbi:response regulator [Actinomadura parmotrematis]|uniref:Response regulator n=1 Tax=Actinomadura parmotrematis TaxID=2864039 RepID=A0ABS7FZ50_9ACTN|nr:response regulator [Actinomadura parmotrematis]MBW8485729.1 response regulator [Actinomadura parmotrematis]